jgi:hypothetical protein
MTASSTCARQLLKVDVPSTGGAANIAVMKLSSNNNLLLAVVL